MPRRIGEFSYLERTDFDDPSLGYGLRFQAKDSLQFDVYIYPSPDPADCDAKCMKEAFDGQHQGFVESFSEMVRRGYADSVRLISNAPLQPKPGAAWSLGQRLTLMLSRRNSDNHSEFWLFQLPGTWVKFRATYVESPDRNRRIDALVEELIPALQNATDVIPERIDRPLPAVASADSLFAILPGTWDWQYSADECVAGQQTISISDDRKTMLLVVAPTEAGEKPDTVRYTITRAGPGVVPTSNWAMRMDMVGETRKGEDGRIVSWDLLLESRDRYHWHRSDWPKGAMTKANIRCDGPTKPL